MAMRDVVFLDTSVFVSGLIEMGDTSSASRDILEAAMTGRLPNARTAWHCCLEFYAVATRLPAGLRVTPELARRMLAESVFARIRIVDLPADQYSGFFDAAAHDRISGGRVYDAHIGEVARAAGAHTFVSYNRRHVAALVRRGIRVVTPDEFVEDRRP